MKKYLAVTFFLLLLLGCERPKGFTLKKITSCHPSSSKWEVTNTLSDAALQNILSQTYSYLGSGNHTYAFVSHDGRYVIKFFKQKHMRTQSPFLSKIKFKKRKQERQESFNSYKIAFNYLKEDTALLYLHLNKTDHLHLSLTLIDQQGIPYSVRVDDMEFLIQRKGTPAFEYLGMLLERGEGEKALIAIRSLLKIVAKRNQMKIYDTDLQLYKNFGFLNHQAIEIDIGEFKLGVEVSDIDKELTKLSYQISEFVKEKAPEFSSIIENEMNEEIDRYS